MPDIQPLGDTAITIRFGETIDEATFRRVQSFVQTLTQSPPRGMIEQVPAFAAVTVHYDVLQTSYEEMAKAVEQACANLVETDSLPSRLMEIPVCYGDEFGPDLDAVATQAKLSHEEVIKLHSQPEYLVYMIGFSPGFPYLGGLDKRLSTPRHATPRLKVAAGSVGIAGEQTGIYPIATPGGWQIIGRTPLTLFRPTEHPPVLLQAGDRVRFVSISREEFERWSR